MKTSRSFSSDPASTRSARHFVLRAVGGAPPGVRDSIAVMVGELTMNAVQHAQTGFQVTVEMTDGTLRVEGRRVRRLEGMRSMSRAQSELLDAAQGQLRGGVRELLGDEIEQRIRHGREE